MPVTRSQTHPSGSAAVRSNASGTDHGTHRRDPLGYQRHRNAAIAELQGNRNPLIDDPEWAERIAFEASFTG